MSRSKVIAAGLRAAAHAIEQLEPQGIRVIAVHAGLRGGHKPVIVVDRMPRFARPALARRRPLLGGVERTYATPYLGVQLERIELAPVVQAVGHA